MSCRSRREKELLGRLTRSKRGRKEGGHRWPRERGREGGRPFKVGKMRGTSGIRLDGVPIQGRTVKGALSYRKTLLIWLLKDNLETKSGDNMALNLNSQNLSLSIMCFGHILLLYAFCVNFHCLTIIDCKGK